MTINEKFLVDVDILKILFDAQPGVQTPFLQKTINKWNEQKMTGERFAKLTVGILKKILVSGNDVLADAKANWIETAKKYVDIADLFIPLESLDYRIKNESYCFKEKNWINKGNEINQYILDSLKINEIQESLSNIFSSMDRFECLQAHFEFQKIFQTAWKSSNVEYLNPLFRRMEAVFHDLSGVIQLSPDLGDEFKMLNIISLVHANQRMKRLIPMLIAKMVYAEQKNAVTGGSVTQTRHLIIDEAHNILNANAFENSDKFQDYRLSVFEEIIKEGRKFGFYLTLASQRPFDISRTIISQLHNYFIHRIVNDKDLKMLENTMPNLDQTSLKKISGLGPGEAIITGTAIPMPIFVQVKKEEIRPNSDNVKLTNIWS